MSYPDHVFSVHSTLEVPHDTLQEYLDDPDLPEPIAELDTTRRGNQLFIEAVPAEEGVGKYTPLAKLRATVSDARVYEYEGERSRTKPSTPDEEPPESEVETFAKFKGRLGTVLQNSALRAPTFSVLHDLAYLADQGHLTAVVDGEEGLEAIRVVDAEDRPASIEVVEEGDHAGETEAVRWSSP